MLSFSPLTLLALSSVALGTVSATNCTQSGKNGTHHGGRTSRKHRHEFGRPSSWNGHSRSGSSWSYSYPWSESDGAVASGSNAYTIIKSASEAIRTVTAPVWTETAKLTATKKASETHKKATATHKATSKAVKSTHKTSAQAVVTTRVTHAASTTKKVASTTRKVTTTKKASSTAAATSTAGATSAIESVGLKSHNAARAEYGAGALTWDGDLVSLAQKWAKGCVWAHGGANGAGQNLAMFSGKDSTIDQAVDMWMNEAGDYDASNPIYSHFTQVVWEATTKLGCAVHYCPTIQGLSYGGNFFVCNYLSAGNVPGEFKANVGTLISL